MAVGVLCFLLAIATVVALGMKSRPGGAELGVALGLTAVYLMVFVRMSIPEERTHLFEYGVLAVFIYEALAERAKGRRVPAPPLLAVLLASSVGTLDELIQAALPNRVFDAADILVNVVAVVAAVAARWVLERLRSRRSAP